MDTTTTPVMMNTGTAKRKTGFRRRMKRPREGGKYQRAETIRMVLEEAKRRGIV